MATQQFFQEALVTALGQALGAAGYGPEENPVQWNGGLYRFRRRLGERLELWVMYQLLAHPDYFSRFQVVLQRVPLAGEARGPALGAARISLPRLLWDVFAVRVLPGPDHWWAFHDVHTLGDGLLESGKLLIGYGLPWLDGSLTPEGRDSG